ncbi:MAG: UPF0146 family protein [Thermodesulfovibrionales bacterium]|nr:UPF0146 family protein [Thermodesulfovibrionales bacterium]
MDLALKYCGLVDFITSRYKTVVEIGIGRFPHISYLLINRGVSLFATDIYPIKHKGIRVIRDDIIKPDVSVYKGVQMLFSFRPPPELVPYMVNLAQRISADLIVKPLSTDHLDGRLTCHKKTTFFLWEHV